MAKICGGKQRTSLESRAKSNALYILDFSDFSKWTQPSVSGKFVASVAGYFCYNEDRKKLLPLAIHVVDTNLTYTPFDNSDDWTLAKMVLDTADMSFQQEQHLADSHAVFIPLRVEVFRNLAAAHQPYRICAREARDRGVLQRVDAAGRDLRLRRRRLPPVRRPAAAAHVRRVRL